MNLADATLQWLLDPINWTGPDGVPTRVLQHVEITLLVLVLALAIAVPLGVAIGHTGRGVTAAVMASGGLRALPTLGLVTLMALWLGIGLEAPVIALVALAIPPPLAGIYAGFQAVDRDVVDTARAVGMTERGIVTSVEFPLAAPSVVGGIRSATLQVVATVTVAAYVADAGLGRYIIEGLRTRDYGEMLAGSLLVIALALVVDAAFAFSMRFTRPAHAPAKGGPP